MKQGWERKKFEDCIGKIPKPQQLKTSDYKLEGRFPIVSQESSIISGYTDFEDYVYRVPKPIVVFGDHTRVLKYVDFDFVVGADGVKILVPTNDIVSKYFYYFLIWYNVPSLGYSRHYKLLKEISIPVPPLPIQERIVEELDCISGIIEKKKEQLKELDALAQSIFYTMFGDPVENDKGWEVKKLGEVTTKIGSGATPKGGNKSYKNEGISLIRSLNVHNKTFLYKDLAHIDDSQAASLNNVIVQEKDVLLNITGASVARCCIVPDNILPARVNQHVAIIRLDKNTDKSFICSQLTTESYQQELLSIGKSNGATREALTKTQLESLHIILPPLPLQQEFAKKIEAIEKQKELIKASIGEVETLLASRMQEYFE